MENYSKILDGWFSELCPMWPGIALSLQIEKVLFSKKSKYQQIDLFQTKTRGKMLVLDGIIQLTEFDEFAYQEMMAHVPLFAHPNPENILVIGGGDGGILREVIRHDIIKNIDFCEIDEEVIAVSKEFLPALACGFDDPRINTHVADGNVFIRGKTHVYDVIIVDSSDPIGPGEQLFGQQFYQQLKTALKPGGIVASQGESFFLHKECVENLMRIVKNLFKQSAYSSITVPTYPGGHIGICMGSMGPEFDKPVRSVPSLMQKQLKYYTPQMHEASFALPYFVKEMFDAI